MIGLVLQPARIDVSGSLNSSCTLSGTPIAIALGVPPGAVICQVVFLTSPDSLRCSANKMSITWESRLGLQRSLVNLQHLRLRGWPGIKRSGPLF